MANYQKTLIFFVLSCSMQKQHGTAYAIMKTAHNKMKIKSFNIFLSPLLFFITTAVCRLSKLTLYKKRAVLILLGIKTAQLVTFLK